MATAITIPAAPTLQITPISVVVPNMTTTEAERILVIAYYLSSFRKLSLTPEMAVSKMVTVLCSSIPELLEYLLTNRAPIVAVRQPGGAMLQALSTHQTPGGNAPEDWAFDSIHDDCVLIGDAHAIYAAAAVAFMTYAKQASEGSRKAYESSRPGALMSKYGLQDDQTGLFPGGDFGPDIDVLNQVNVGFSMYTGLRYLITAFFISIKRAGRHPPPNLDPFMVVFQLLRNTGMTHVGAIRNLFETHPWTVKVPELTPYYRKYAEELRKLQLIEPDLRPYHRVLVDQNNFLFLTSELRPLVAVAGDFQEEVEQTFKGYVYGKDQYTALIAKVRARNPNLAANPDTLALAALFNIPDVEPAPLPQSTQPGNVPAPTTQL